MTGAVIAGVGHLAAARAGMNLAHHGAISLFSRPHLNGVTVRAANGFRSLHETFTPLPFLRGTLSYVLKRKIVAPRQLTAARQSRTAEN
jgi:hypothetical protein